MLLKLSLVVGWYRFFETRCITYAVWCFFAQWFAFWGSGYDCTCIKLFNGVNAL